MKVLLKIMVFFIFVGAILGCTKTVQPIESMFQVSVDNMTDVKVNEPFTINGYLTNVSKKSWQLSHGAGMFTYQIVDEEDNLVPREIMPEFLFRNDIGFSSFAVLGKCLQFFPCSFMLIAIHRNSI